MTNFKDIITPTGGAGVTSCLSVRLSDAIAYRKAHGSFPSFIDSSRQFLLYQDRNDQDVSKFIIAPCNPDNSLPEVDYDHGWQFGWYDEIGLEVLAKIALNICPVTTLIGNKSYEMASRIKGRTAVLYRGNDKALDIPRTHYNAMLEMAKATGSKSFVVQTDENDFYRFFKQHYPDTICFDEIPRINKDPDAYVMPERGERVMFAVNFVSALRALASCEKVIMNTGNTGIWLMFFRGNTRETWQVHGRNQQWRKLN